MCDDPAARLELIARTYHGPIGNAPRHSPFRRAALSFMRWQIGRGVLAPLGAMPPGSPWWRAVNERLMRDGCEAVARSGGMGGTPSSHTVDLWMLFVGDPTARTWYRAHNASIASEWSADELDDPGLLDCICDGSPTCAWSYSDREVWHPASPAVTIRAVRRILPAN